MKEDSISFIPRHEPAWWQIVALAGGAAGFLMAVLLILVMGLGQGRGFWTYLSLVGSTIVPLRFAHWYTALVGGVAHLLVATLWGLAFGFLLLYGVGRLRTSAWAAIAYGIAWGSFVWAVMGLYIGPFLDPPLGALFDDLLWFGAHLVYGVLLALFVLAMPSGPQLRAVFARHKEPAEVKS